MTNNFTISFFNVICSITNYQKMHVYLNPSNQLLLNISNQLGTYNLSINMQYFYYINEETKAMIESAKNATESLQNVVSSSSSSSTFLAAGSSFIFLNFISINSIAFLQYFDIKYPKNVDIVFKAEIPTPDVFSNYEIDDRLEDGSLPDSYHNYRQISIYSLNTVGNMILESCVFWLIGLLIFVTSKKLHFIPIEFLQVLLILLYLIFVWNYSINDINSKYLHFSFYIFLGFRYPTLQTTLGVLNFCYNISMGIFTMILYPWLIIYKIKIINKKILSEIKQDVSKIIEENEKLKEIKVKTPNEIFNDYFDSLFKKKKPIVMTTKQNTPTSNNKFINKSDSKLFSMQLGEITSTDPIRIKNFNKETSQILKIDNEDKSPEKMLSLKKKSSDLIKMRPDSYRYGAFHNDFTQNSIFVSYFIVWILIKDLLYSLIIVLTFDHPFVGLILLFILRLLYIISMFLLKPFKQKLDLFHNLFNEICVISSIGSATYIAYMDLNGINDEEVKIKAGWGIMLSNNSILLVSLMRILFEFIKKIFLFLKTLKNFLKDRCKKQNKVAAIGIEIEKTEIGIFEQILQMKYILE